METNNSLVALNSESLDFNNIPLTALSQRSREILSRLLNQIKIFKSEEGFMRDYRGLAHLAGILVDTSSTAIQNDPTENLLKLWCKKFDTESATFHNLLRFLGRIDRFDVADDVSDSLVVDAKNYQLKQQHLQIIIDNPAKSPESPLSFKSDVNILTTDDVHRSHKGLPPQQYDAFVLFADEDIDFATELIENMENCGFKLCAKERDLLAGASLEHDAILRLISERCNRLIVIVSPAFLESDANKFFVAFAQALGLDQRCRKIIPCLLYEHCRLPATLKYCFSLNYQRSGKLWNFWDKLRKSIETTPEEIEERQQISMPRITITEVESSQSLTPITKQLQIKDKPSNNVQTPPVKAQRKRRDEKLSLRFDDPNSLNTMPNSYSSASSVDLYGSPGTPDSMKQQLQIMPPRPKMRNSSSMIDLSSTSPTSSDVFLDIAKNGLSLNGPAKSSQNLAKKPKWYKKLLSPNSIPNSSHLSDDESKEKPKKRWFRRKLATLSS